MQADLLKALAAAPDEWFSRLGRGVNWPNDVDSHSAGHRVKDIQRALARRKAGRR